MARKYHIEGTRAFLIWAVVLLALGLWCVRDGWFPSEATLATHPPGKPDDNFYVFNKSLAVLSLAASVVCGYVHLLVR